MCSLRKQVIFVALTLFATGAYSQDIVFKNHVSREASVCNTTAQCVPLPSCPAVLQSKPFRLPRPCGYNGRIPRVCCSDMEGSNIVPGTSSPGISAPKVSFECGKASTRIVPQRPRQEAPAGTLVRRRRVIGGRPVPSTVVWPWLAVVGERNAEGEIRWYCVASLLNEQWLITALHCFSVVNPNIVRLGEHNYDDLHDGAKHQDFDIAESVYHPNGTFPMLYDDIALIRLPRKLELKDTISPICLPWGHDSNENFIGRDLLLTGWGTTVFGGDRSPILNDVNMTVFDPSVCNNSYSQLRAYTLNYPRGIDDSFLCMGHPQGGLSACQGDSGGPLMYYNDNGRYVLAGVVSSGYGCGAREYPGVHTNLALESRLTWIKKVAFS